MLAVATGAAKKGKPATEFNIPRSKSGPVLLSLDTSSTATGYAVFHGRGLVCCGVIRPKATLPALDRVGLIVADVEALTDAAAPDEIVMEISSGKVHGRIAKASGLAVLGHAQGAIWEAVRRRMIPLTTVAENEWTKSKKKADRAAHFAGMYLTYADFAKIQWHATKGCTSKADPGFDAADAVGIGDWFNGKKRDREMFAMYAKRVEGGDN